MTFTTHRAVVGLAVAAGAAFLAVPPASASTPALDPTFPIGGFHVFSRSFHENVAEHTVSLPRYTGLSQGRTVTFVITDASTKQAAEQLGVNWSPRLGNAAGTAAAQHVTRTKDGLSFPASVDFGPIRVVVPGPTEFPPAQAVPGAVGEPGYSPVVELPDGTVLNAPQIANASGRADKVVRINGVDDDRQRALADAGLSAAGPGLHDDQREGRVVYRETNGFYEHKAVHYVSFEASIPLAAALENAALAPALDAAPPDFSPRPDPVPPAREEIGIVTNGRTGSHNPQRQGLSSALLDGLDPLNILGEVPGGAQSGYSPLWDANLATWTPQAIAAGLDRRQTSFPDLRRLAAQGLITAPDGGPFRRSDFVINCPAIAIRS